MVESKSIAESSPARRWWLILAVIVISAVSFAGWKLWTAPRVDPALIGEWIEEFEREDGSRLDLKFSADGSCDVGLHAEELLSSYLMEDFPAAWGTMNEESTVWFTRRYTWGVQRNRMVLASIEEPYDGPPWGQLKFRIANLLLGKDREMQVYQIVERSQSRLHLRQVSGEGRFRKELKLVRWQE